MGTKKSSGDWSQFNRNKTRKDLRDWDKTHMITKYLGNLNVILLEDVDELENETVYYCIIAPPTTRHLDDLKKCLTLANKPKKHTYRETGEEFIFKI